MWGPDEIAIELEIADHPEVVIAIELPQGTLRMVGALSIAGRIAYIDGVHIQGLRPGRSMVDDGVGR